MELEDLKTKSIKELAQIQRDYKQKIEELRAEATEFQKIYDLIRNRLLPEKMDEQGVENIKLEGIGKISLSPVLQVSVPSETRDMFYQWLVENGHGDIIQEYAQPATVKALIQEQIRNGEQIPEDLISIHAFTQARITKG